MSIALRLKELRSKKGLSQKDLAKKSGISDGMIGGIENGTRNPSKKTLEKLSKVFDVSTSYLENGVDNTQSMIDNFLDALILNGIIKDKNNIEEDVKLMILKTVEADIALRMKKLENK